MNDSVQVPQQNKRGPGISLQSVRRELRKLAWLSVGMTLLTLALIFTLLALLNTEEGHREVIQMAEKQVSDRSGVQVKLDNFAVHFSTLSVDLYGVSVFGASPYANPPLLQVSHVEASVGITSIFRRAWYLRTIQIDHPVAWVVVDKNGVSNIPTLTSSSSGGNTDIFQLGIRHVVLSGGEAYYNSVPSALSADLHDLDFGSSFDGSRSMYSGKLSYADGKVQYGSLQPIQHTIDAEFQVTPGIFQITQAKLTSGASQAALSATLKSSGSAPSLEGRYDIALDGEQLAESLREPSVPVGLIHTSGSIQYQQVPNKTMIQALVVNGDLHSATLKLNSPAIHTDVRNLAAHYSLAGGNATLKDLRAELLGGEVEARGAVQAIDGESHASFRAELHHVSLVELRQATRGTSQVNEVALTGEADASATATWGKTITDLVAHLDASVNGKMTRTPTAGSPSSSANAGLTANRAGSGAEVPIRGAVRGTYTNSSQNLTLDSSYLRTAQTNLTAKGALSGEPGSKRSSVSVQLQANDLREVATLVDLFRTPGTAQTSLDLAGKASLQASVEGSITEPQVKGQLNGESLRINGADLRILRTGFDVSPSHVSLSSVDVEPVGHGRITGNANADLQKWSFTKQSPIQVELTGSDLDIAALTRLTGQQIPATGTLNAAIHIHGDLENPMGNGNVAITNASAYEEPISSVKVDFNGSGSQAQGNIALLLPAGTIQCHLSVQPQQRLYTAQLTSAGIDLSKLRALQVRNIEAIGVVAIQAHGQGSFDNPELDSSIQIPTLTMGGQTISGTKLQMTVANHIANAELVSSVMNSPVHAKAQVNLSGDFLADATIDSQPLSLAILLAAVAPDEASDVSGQTEIHATLHGPLKKQNELEAHLTIPVLKVAYSHTIQLAATAPIKVDYKNGIIELQPATLRGTDTDVQVQGSISTNGSAPMSLKAQGTVDLQLVQLFDPDFRSSGKLKLNVDSHGAANNASFAGEIELVDANISSPTLPVGLQHGNGVFKLTPDRLEISKLEGTVGGGSVTATGAVLLRPKIQFDLGAVANGVRMLYPQGMRETVNANLRLSGSPKSAVLGGSVNIADLSFTPAFDLDAVVNQLSGSVTPPLQDSFQQNLVLNIAVNSTSTANLVSRALSVSGSANLQARGTAAEPVILGRVNLSGGDAILNGNRFVLTGGTVQFINPTKTQPVVNLSLTTTIQEYKIDLRLSGPADQLRTQYSSDPSLPSADIINLLAFGQTTEASAMSTMSTNQQAESLVASQVSSQVTSRLSKAAGISQLSISRC
jgi:translocation and assembly module TamB